MKKFNKVIIVSVIVYFISAMLIGSIVISFQESKIHDYRVESNYILAQLQEEKEIHLEEYTWIKEMSLLSANVTNREEIQKFYTEENQRESFIQPFYKGETLVGYIKFVYTEMTYSFIKIFFIIESILLLLFLSVILLLLYIKYKVILPFERFSSLPEALAKGHYKGNIKMEKSKYFKQFLLGMSQLKDELEVSKKRQLELLKDKKQLLLSLSHDIKTPLNLIKLYEKSLEENLYSNEQEKTKALKQIEEKSIEIEKYVEEITTSFREEILDLPVEITDFYLANVLEGIFNIYKEKCGLRQIKFMAENYENRLVKGDKNRLQEVIENVLENAIKYGDGKEICVTFSEEEYCYLIHIYNSGQSVPEQELLHLFDSFFRGMNATGKQGSGLGLYIAKQLMHKMDGDIYAQNREAGMMYTIVLH